MLMRVRCKESNSIIILFLCLFNSHLRRGLVSPETKLINWMFLKISLFCIAIIIEFRAIACLHQRSTYIWYPWPVVFHGMERIQYAHIVGERLSITAASCIRCALARQLVLMYSSGYFHIISPLERYVYFYHLTLHCSRTQTIWRTSRKPKMDAPRCSQWDKADRKNGTKAYFQKTSTEKSIETETYTLYLCKCGIPTLIHTPDSWNGRKINRWLEAIMKWRKKNHAKAECLS